MPEFDLDRFVAAQADIYDRALAELKAGRKQSHWMWFVFPQIAGLGRSPTARFYAIASAAEARAYLAHPLLGARLGQCIQAVLAHAPVRVGDVLSFALRGAVRVLRIEALPARRGPPAEARALYSELTSEAGHA